MTHVIAGEMAIGDLTVAVANLEGLAKMITETARECESEVEPVLRLDTGSTFGELQAILRSRLAKDESGI